MRRLKPILCALLLAALCLAAAAGNRREPAPAPTGSAPTAAEPTSLPAVAATPAFSAEDLPQFTGEPFTEINGNLPFFTEAELQSAPFEQYGAFDALGRCTAAFALVGRETMPTESRGEIGMIRPTGWRTVKYESVDGGYLYNRCHLIGFQLTGENANPQNLITGTRYLNKTGMLPFENAVARYVGETGRHVLYRATPVFFGEELLARGVLLEARSVEDGGAGLMFCVFCHNVQPGVILDYATGESRSATEPETSPEQPETFVLNLNSGRFHRPDCDAVAEMKEENKKTLKATCSDLLADGYTPCGRCRPDLPQTDKTP